MSQLPEVGAWECPDYDVHPVAAIFPMCTEEELQALAKDIAENGQTDPIVVFGMTLLDGRNRLRACEIAGKQPEIVEWDGDEDEIVPWILSKNLHRRHLSTSQRAAVAASLAKLEHGQRQSRKFAGVPTQAQAAQMLGVSERSVQTARKVIESGDEKLIEAVKSGEMSVSAAAASLKPAPEGPTAADALVAFLDRHQSSRERPHQLSLARLSVQTAIGRTLTDKEWIEIVEAGRRDGRWCASTTTVQGRLIGPIWLPTDPAPSSETMTDVASSVGEVLEESDLGEGPVMPDDHDDPALQGHLAAGEEWVECPACGGSGEESGTDDDCSGCDGEGGWYDDDCDDTDTDTDAEPTSQGEGHDSAASGASESGRVGRPTPDPAAPTPFFDFGTAVFNLRKLLSGYESRNGGFRCPLVLARPQLEGAIGMPMPEGKWPEVLEAGQRQRFWDCDDTHIWSTEAPSQKKIEKLSKRTPAMPPDELPAPKTDLPEKTERVSERSDYDSDSWGTPAAVIEDVRAVLGEIDLDPASNDAAQQTVQATKYYTKATDGLAQAWAGRVWLNPPFSHPLVEQFTDKLTTEYDSGNVTAALLVVNNATDTRWFQRLLKRFPACFPEGRLAFVYADGSHPQARQGQAFFYLGPDAAKFREVFGKRGTIVEAA